jgi:hypothetical protein
MADMRSEEQLSFLRGNRSMYLVLQLTLYQLGDTGTKSDRLQPEHRLYLQRIQKRRAHVTKARA